MINETNYENNPLTKEQETQVDALFAEYDNKDTPGCAVGVINDGEFIYKKSFGMANLDYDIPITADSKFELGSTSKQFTAACIALLQLDGKLNIDDEVRKYIPELPDYGKIIKISHLIHHTSGIRDFYNLLWFSFQPWEDYFTKTECLKLVCRQKELDFIPGDKYSYSNSGYFLLAEIINRVNGKSIREYADEMIFKPLKMNDTYFGDHSSEIVKKRVTSYGIQNKTHTAYFSNSVVLGPSGVLSTVNDMLKWDRNFYNPVVGGQQMLDLMRTKGVLNNGETIPYAFGLIHNSYKGFNNTDHAGGILGFRCQLTCFQEQKISVIFLANRVDCNPNYLPNIIANTFLPETKETITEKTPKVVEEYTPVKLSDSELDKFCDFYWCEEEKINRKIIIKDNCLYYWRADNYLSKLIPISNNELIMEGSSSDVKLIFEFDNNQKIINFFQNGIFTSKYISYKPVSYTPEDLAKFCGKYYSYDLDVYYQILLDADKLRLKFRNKNISELPSMMENTFRTTGNGCTFKFSTNDRNEIKGFVLDAEGVKNINFDRC
ncbi:MAG: serine hydrolase domain-containing protein [Candidatus Tenebribacter davisii]|nr:serine hydrolase domain-containing protein [Candidatus Tenebribacter davisii]